MHVGPPYVECLAFVVEEHIWVAISAACILRSAALLTQSYDCQSGGRTADAIQETHLCKSRELEAEGEIYEEVPG